MGWKKLIVISLPLLFSGCLSFYHHPQGGFRPKKPDFSLVKELFIYNKIIDTIAIYVSIDTLKYKNSKSVSFFKFYNNGRQFKSNKETDDFMEKSNFRPLDIGYYIVKDDSILVENFIVNPQNKNDTEYRIKKGIIKKDTIVLIYSFIKNKLFFSN